MRLQRKNLVMGLNFLEVKDNLLTKKECTDVIEYVRGNRKILQDANYEHSQYSYCDLYLNESFDRGINAVDPFGVKDKSFVQAFSAVPLRPLKIAFRDLKEAYEKKYSEVETIDPWGLEYVRFKWWKPGEYYHAWHSEHGRGITPRYRVLSFLICLSDNDSYTEFRRHRNVRTKAGRGIIFPAYHTHQHRGSLCKKRLDRYMLGGYFSFLKDGQGV
tara:strand:- start:50 stop:697 length:648 start_codon:yes stop_codon:yes gene_type:complete